MLISKIRGGIKHPIIKGFLFFCLIALFGGAGLLGLINRLWTGRTGNAFIVINGQEISRALFERKRHEAQEQINSLHRRFGKSADILMAMQGINPNAEESALETVVQETLLDQAVHAIPVYLAPEYVATKLQDPYFLVSKIYHLMPQDIINQQGRININAFNQFLATTDLKPLEDELESSLERDMGLVLLSDAAWTPQIVLNDLYASQKQEKKFSIARFSLDKAIQKEKEKGTSDQEIKKFFDEQNDKNKRYYIPAKRNGVKWIFDQKDFNITVSQKEIEDYYNKVKRSRFIETPAQVKIREIIFDQIKDKGLNELKKEAEKVHQEAVADPKQFAKLAEQYSANKATAKNGGLVDFFKRGTKDKALEKEAFRLKANEDISSVIQLEKGFAIIQRVDRKEATFKPLDKVKAEVEKILKEKKFSTEFIKGATRVIRSDSKEAQERFDTFVTRNKGTKEQVEAVAKEEGPVAGRLFALKKRGDKVVYMSEGKGVILELGDSLKKNLPPFEMLKSYVEKDFFTDRAKKAIKADLKKLRQETVAAGKLTVSGYATLEVTDWIAASDDKKLKALFEKGIPQDIMLLDKKGGVLSVMGQTDGFVIRLDELKAVTTGQEESENELKNGIREQIQSLFLRSFIASLNRTAKIETSTVSNRGDYQV